MHQMRKITAVFGAIALSFGAGQAMAAMSSADQTFATKAAAGGQAEVALGHLATENAGSAKVKEFGQRMVKDHSQANQELQQIARQQNLTIPDKPDAADQATEQRLRTMKGEQFDDAYMRDMVQDHKKDITEFRQEADNGTDPALKSFAQKYLPVLQQHLQMAESTAPK
jgi:putative membrane protein